MSTQPSHVVLAGLRASIDEIDAELVELLERRARVAIQIGELKRAIGHPIVDPAREDQVLRLARDRPRRVLPDEALRCIFSEIIRACRELQRP